ncbi:hypothetical protein JCM6882_003084 [Rhodosporidiobolus microsporus]
MLHLPVLLPALLASLVTLSSASPSPHRPVPTAGFVLARRSSHNFRAFERRQENATDASAGAGAGLAASATAEGGGGGAEASPLAAPAAEGGAPLNATGATMAPTKGSESAGAGLAAAAGGDGEGASPPADDPNLTVLQLALVLENLESLYYKQGLAAFPVEKMVKAGLSELQATIIIEQITVIQGDEGSHVKALEGAITALSGTPFSGCNFNFDQALKDPMTFLSTARVLEAAGQGAYLGAAHLLTDPQLLTAAGSILTLEARHQSLLNVFNGGSFAPQPFDIALTPQGVLALAGGFLRDCQASDLGLTANNPLIVTDEESGKVLFKPGSKLAFKSIVPLELESLTCQMIVGGAPSAVTFPAKECVVPGGIDGPVAVYLVNSTVPLASNIIIQNAAAITAGPALVFVDSKPSILSSFFSHDGGDGYASGYDGGGGEHDANVELKIVEDDGSFSSSSHRRLVRSPRPVGGEVEKRHGGGNGSVKVHGWTRRRIEDVLRK